ncbi:MAG: SAM-dependent methyltransferase [bacterium]|nr:SAM-dependent methyltransferase [bacterium]
MTDGVHPASFRDPSGFLFRAGGRLLRQVNEVYADDYRALMESGLYEKLTSKGWLIPHEELDVAPATGPGAWKVIAPEEIPFVSYPYEWSFSQLKDAALRSLAIQKVALRHDLVLKDASAYNIQFHRGKPVLIDTLSFTPYEEGSPWVAYRQFCQHFLAPLALMAQRDIRLGNLLRTNMDGVPLDLASKLLPARSKLRPGLLMHVHAHAASQRKHQDKGKSKVARVGRRSFEGIVDSLRGAVRRLQWKPPATEWGAYYDDTNYSDASLQAKRDLVDGFVARTEARTAWDLGANNGTFSRVATGRGIFTVAADIDPVAVEFNYRRVKETGEENLLPLLMDLTNPSPALGWGHAERDSLLNRGPADLVLALALVHHLAIGNNVPLARVAEFFAAAARWLIVEFVPKSDSQVRRLLATREDVFPEYAPEGFKAAFAATHETVDVQPIPGTERSLHLMRRLARPDDRAAG